jgi:hypothetical protein
MFETTTVNQEKIGGRNSGESVRPLYTRSTGTSQPATVVGTSNPVPAINAKGAVIPATQPQFAEFFCAQPSHLQDGLS